MKVIILGCGQQGALLSKMLEEDGIEVSVIDFNYESFKKLEKFNGEKISGSGIDKVVLEKAKIQSADAFIALSGNDNINLMASQMARAIYKVPRVICRLHDPRRASIYADLGLETISFTVGGARLLKSTIIGPGIVKKFQLGNGTGVAVEVRVSESVQNKMVWQVEIPGIFRIASIIRGLDVLVPEPDTILKANDHIFGVVLAERLESLIRDLKSPRPETTEGIPGGS